jgi:hypothetical protein
MQHETSFGVPRNQSDSTEAIIACLRDAGIEFIGDPANGPGIRLWKNTEKEIGVNPKQS